eukprot:scaffold18312_cov77-Cyclotella_meneghiniana.AAC.8
MKVQLRTMLAEFAMMQKTENSILRTKVKVKLYTLCMISSSLINKHILTQLNAPSTGNGGGVNLGNRCLLGLTNNGEMYIIVSVANDMEVAWNDEASST